MCTERVRFLSLAATFLASLSALPAAALTGDTGGAFGIDGTFRTTLFGLRNYESPELFGAGNDYDVLSISSLRIIAMGQPKDWLAFQIHVQQDVVATTIPTTNGQPSPLQPAVRRFRAVRDEWDWVDDDDAVATVSPDRYNLRFMSKRADLTIGRQAITLGTAYLWNPLDIFGAFDPQQFDRDFKNSVDAARLSVALGESAGMEVIGAVGRELTGPTSYRNGGRTGADWYGSAVLGRLYTALLGADLSIQGGKSYGGHQLGIGAVREIGLGVQLRGEAAYTWASTQRPPTTSPSAQVVVDSLQAVLSIGRRWASSFDLEAEYYFNDAGESRRDLDAGRVRQILGTSQQWGRNYLGATASYEFLSILTGRIVTIWSLTDNSALIQPFLTWSVRQDSDLLIGALIHMGDRPTATGDPESPVTFRSEFGSYPSSLFVQFKTFF